ncbi:MAG: outer membrane lipoprotein-sorting protein [Cyclobacteriaceae bacterium]|jgi:outer membrane lipoprotein-sorting protein
MKRLILIIVVVGVTFLTSAQSASEVLERHFEENGQQIWDQIESVEVAGRWVTKEYKGYSMKLTYKRPDKIRIEGYWNRQKYIEASNGRMAWIVAPWTDKKTPQLMSSLEQLVLINAYSLGSPLKQHEKDLQFNGLISFKGELFLSFTFETDFIKKDFYIDQDDYRLYWEVVETKSGSKKFKIEKQFEKYKLYNSLLVPTSVRIFSHRNEREFVFDNVTLGAGASYRLFEMPAGE